MRLEIDSVKIEELTLDERTYLDQRTLHIDPSDLEKRLLEDNRIKSVAFDVVRPGDWTRVVNLIDVIQPRCKISPLLSDFPGWVGKRRIAGSGQTTSLEGCTVALCNHFSRRPYAGIMDSFGRGAELSRYGKMVHLVLDPEPNENVSERDFELAAKTAGLRAAVYLARAAENHRADSTELYDLESITYAKSKLPRVAYCSMLYTPQHDYRGISDPILYGGPVTEMLPTIIHPNEILDGALVNALTIRGMETYSLQNHALIKELYKRHGRDLIFAGVIIYAASLDPSKRDRNALIASSLASNVLHADGILLTKLHGGMPSVDQALVAEACENLGIKSTIFVHLFNRGGSLMEAASLASLPTLHAVINVGHTLDRMHLSRAEKILGGNAQTPIYCADFKQYAGDRQIDIEQYLIAGVHDHIGGSRIVAVDY
ncbi:MAG TPA: glycine/sarcosine/betaine reductase component B subunit [Syntrophorhabdales bacterium]|nr:glycine/sarcosine/betaine reductase component B subunit [Syntrophorhabdales bacterium]